MQAGYVGANACQGDGLVIPMIRMRKRGFGLNPANWLFVLKAEKLTQRNARINHVAVDNVEQLFVQAENREHSADYIIFKPKIPHPTTHSSSKLTIISQVL